MFWNYWISSLVLIGFCLWPLQETTAGTLTLTGKRCGTILCQSNQFCSKFHSQCQDCETICNESSHNFDLTTCTQECQDYLHDMRYAKSSNIEADIKDLQKQQKILLIITLIILILFLIIHGFHFIRWCRRRDYLSLNCLKFFKSKKVPKPPIGDITHTNPYTESPKLSRRTATNGQELPPVMIPNGRNSTVFSVSGTAFDNGSTIQTVSTPISTRHPAEDSTLDYSYDNAGLAVTPSPITDKPKTETTF